MGSRWRALTGAAPSTRGVPKSPVECVVACRHRPVWRRRLVPGILPSLRSTNARSSYDAHMALDPAHLPDDIAALKAMLVAASVRADDLDAEIENLKLLLAKMRHDKFGASSERTSVLTTTPRRARANMPGASSLITPASAKPTPTRASTACSSRAASPA